MISGFEKFDLTGKTALVTGGGTGIGYEMTKALAKSGAKVMMAARREDVLKAAAEKIMSELSIRNVLYHPVDLLDRASVKALADHALKTLGGVDIFIGNAGLESPRERIEQITYEAMDQQLRVNLTANIELTKEFLPHMRKKKWGRVIYSSSAASVMGTAEDYMSVYGAAKSAINGFTKYVAAEAGADGVTANSLVLGFFMTDMLREALAAMPEIDRVASLKAANTMVCVRRPGSPEEVAGLVQLLASDAGSYITGACIPIDGGFTATLRPSSAE